VEAARQEYQRLTQWREQVAQRLRAMGHAYPCVDLERGVRRNGKLIASVIQEHIATLRTMAQQAQCSETCLERCFSAPAPMWKGATGISRCAITNYEAWTIRGNGRA